MESYETVKVYSFRIFDIEIGAMSHATYKASRETIAASPGSEVLEGTEQEVAFGSWTETAVTDAWRQAGASSADPQPTQS